VLLWHSSALPPAASAPSGWESTIAAHAPASLALLLEAAAVASPWIALCLVAALAAPALLLRARTVGWAALFALLLYLIVPYGYSGPGPQLANGASLRYAAPAIALGALALASATAPFPIAASALAILFAAVEAGKAVALYSNDLPTLSSFGVALLAVGATVLARRLGHTWPVVAGFAVAIAASWILASRQPAAYYADALAVRGERAGVYAWLAHAAPPAVGGVGLRLGTVNVLSPATATLDLPDAGSCAAARTAGVVLIAVAESDRSSSFNAGRLAAARACGKTLYDDGIAVVSLP